MNRRIRRKVAKRQARAWWAVSAAALECGRQFQALGAAARGVRAALVGLRGAV